MRSIKPNDLELPSSQSRLHQINELMRKVKKPPKCKGLRRVLAVMNVIFALLLLFLAYVDTAGDSPPYVVR
jgi:hypothetical protein